jgi:hypothetical protein
MLSKVHNLLLNGISKIFRHRFFLAS